MPELPEVHTIMQDLKRAGIIGRNIEKAIIYWPRTIASPSPSQFCRRIINQHIVGLDRRGKYLIFILSDGNFLCIHLRMTGKLLLVDQDTPESPYVRVRLDLDNQQALHYHDTRKFGRWHLVSDLESVVGKMGPEPLSQEFSFESFWNILHHRKKALKPLLLDQIFLAGLGNIYVDEALWKASLHPLLPANLVSPVQAQALHQAIIFVLKRGIDNQGTTLGTGKTNYYRLDGTRGQHQTLLDVFRCTGQPCARCNHSIERIIVAQRGTHICPYCQQLDIKRK